MNETTLAELRQQFHALETTVDALVTGLSDAQLAWQPDPARWSIAHCLDHMNITDRGYLINFEKALEQLQARNQQGDGTVRFGFLEAKFIRWLEPPPGRQVSAPRAFQPALDRPPAEVVAELESVREKFLTLLDAAEGFDVNRARVPSPATRLLRFRLGSAFAIAVAHDRRHVWQAQQVREHADFPVA
jgi:hypothetical protein